jgi:hypothetical protein
MGHQFLNDLASQHPDALIMTSTSAKKGDPHLPADKNQMTITMAEVTDDSYLFATSIQGLQTFTLHMEQFQYTYGWLTQWVKTCAYILLGGGSLPDKLSFPSITNEKGVDPLLVTKHEVPLICDKLEFLQAKVDNPTARHDEL